MSKDAKNSQDLSRRLKRYYQSVQEEKIPDHFLDLLEKLSEAEAKQKVSGNQSSGNQS